MKHLAVRAFFVFAIASLFANTSFSQQPDGCTLSSWVLKRAPGAYRTPEPAPQLRDTVVNILGINQKISIPQGFTIKRFDTGKDSIPKARGLALSPDGVIYVTSYRNQGIYALPDHNHDGVPDSTILVAKGLGNGVHGLGFYHGKLYATSDSKLYRLDDTNGDRVADKVVTITTLSGSGNHVTRNFAIDTILNKFYIQVGSTCNYCHETDSERATILEMNPDGSGRRIYVRGVRNMCGLDIDPRTNNLWGNMNGMDDLFGKGSVGHNDTPPEGVYLFCDGMNYGWPYAYGFRMRNPDAAFQIDTSIIQTYGGPVAEVLAHEAPLGMHFYRGATFPAKYHNAIFMTYHGSWDRTPPAPPRVTVLTIDEDGKNGSVTDFLNGFQPDSTTWRFGRVVSVVEGADSAIYVTDDAVGAVYRITWTGPVQTNLFLDSYPLAGRGFQNKEILPIRWISNNVDSVLVYVRMSEADAWTLAGGTRGNSFQLTLPSIPSPSFTKTAEVKIVDAKSAIESVVSRPFRVSNSSGVSSSALNHSGLSIGGSYPNPFRDVVAVRFSLSSVAHIHADLLDILGNRVATVLDEPMDIGEHEAKVVGAELASGVYFLRITDGESVTSVRIVKAK